MRECTGRRFRARHRRAASTHAARKLVQFWEVTASPRVVEQELEVAVRRGERRSDDQALRLRLARTDERVQEDASLLAACIRGQGCPRRLPRSTRSPGRARSARPARSGRLCRAAAGLGSVPGLNARAGFTHNLTTPPTPPSRARNSRSTSHATWARSFSTGRQLLDLDSEVEPHWCVALKEARDHHHQSLRVGAPVLLAALVPVQVAGGPARRGRGDPAVASARGPERDPPVVVFRTCLNEQAHSADALEAPAQAMPPGPLGAWAGHPRPLDYEIAATQRDAHSAYCHTLRAWTAPTVG